MSSPQTTVPPRAEEDARAALTSRVIPQMSLSVAQNPLTAPLPPASAQSVSDKVAARFAIEGNACITGGAGTLALASARALLEHGLSGLCLLDLPQTLASSRAHIESLEQEFPNVKIHRVVVDVTSENAVRTALDQCAHLMSSIDILCCFAGIVGCVHSISASSAEFKKVIDVNLSGSFLCAQATAKHMIASKRGGSILFTASISAHHTNFPQPQAAYNVSKAGVLHLTRNLAAEWAVHGIRVNSISPGYMDTILNAGDNLQKVRDVWASRCPMGRMGDVEEITGPVVLLCSKRGGRYITGADLLVDGGAMCLPVTFGFTTSESERRFSRSAMGDHVGFFYGTLMFPGILHRVIYGTRDPEPWQLGLTKVRPALLEGYRRHKVKHLQYPAIVPCKDANVRGSMCTGLTDGDMWRLDIFEGDDYEKVKVKVKLLRDDVGIADSIPDEKLYEYVVGEAEAEVYVWKESERYRLEAEAWDFEEFKRNKMKKWTGEEDSPGTDVDDGFRDVEDAIAEIDEAVDQAKSNRNPAPIRANDLDGGR